MKKIFQNMLLLLLLVFLSVSAYANGDENLPKAKTPMLITTAGQGPGGEIVNVLAKRNKIEGRLVSRATVEYLGNNKTLIVVLSSSLKGMGAAGVSLNDEFKRLDKLITEAEKRDILIIGAHLEGETRRGGYDEDIIKKIAPRMEYLIVRKDGNSDGIFDKISKSNNIPLHLIDKTMEINNVLIKIFK